jgi:Icc-related predicted phosphoesterase
MSAMAKPLTILALSDLHMQGRCLEYLDQALVREKPGLVLVAGDITERKTGAVDYLQSFLTLIKKKHRLPLFGVHGNNDSPEIFDLLEATGVSLHLRVREHAGWRFSGIGGWGDLSETVLDTEEALRFNPEGTVFVTHVPPRRDLKLEDHLPLLHLAGHTHSTERIENLQGVPVIRLKTAMLGRAALIKLPEREIRFIDLAVEKPGK